MNEVSGRRTKERKLIVVEAVHRFKPLRSLILKNRFLIAAGLRYKFEVKEMMGNEKLTTKQAADFLGISKGTMDVWRCTKRYVIPYIKIGSRVFYLRSDLEKFMAENRIDDVSENCF